MNAKLSLSVSLWCVDSSVSPRIVLRVGARCCLYFWPISTRDSKSGVMASAVSGRERRWVVKVYSGARGCPDKCQSCQLYFTAAAAAHLGVEQCALVYLGKPWF